MTTFKHLDDFLLQDCEGKFVDKTWLFGLFGAVTYTPTGEKVSGGFRYFTCDRAALLQTFEPLDLPAMARLPFALDEDGDPDDSALLIALHYTESGSMLALQVQGYDNHQPVDLSPPVLLEGAASKALLAQVRELDQSN